MQNLSNLTQLDLLDEESYLQPHIIAKAKQYDFLPLAYHSEMIQEKIRGEFADQKLQAQLEMCQKFQAILGKAKDCLEQWESTPSATLGARKAKKKVGFFPQYNEVRQRVHAMQGTCQEMKRRHLSYAE